MLTPTSHLEIMSRARTPEELAGHDKAATASVAGLSKLSPDEEDPGRLWAEIARLCAALKKGGAAPQGADSDYAEKTAFYAMFGAAEKVTGHKPSHYDVWLMARGLMGANGRAAPQAAPVAPTVQPLTEAQIKVMKEAAADQGLTGIAPSLHLARAVEAHHGITAAPTKEAP